MVFWAGRTICPQVRFPSHITWLIKGHLKGNLQVPLSMVGGNLKRGHMWKRVGGHMAGQNLGLYPDNVQQREGPVSPTSLWFFPFPFFTFKVNGESGNLGKGTCPIGGAQHIFCFPHCALQGVDLSLFHMGPPRGSVLELTGWEKLLDFWTCSKDYPQSYSQKTYQRSISQNLSMKSDSWFLSSHFLLYVSLLANYRMSGWTTKGKGIHGSYTYCLLPSSNSPWACPILFRPQ